MFDVTRKKDVEVMRDVMRKQTETQPGDQAYRTADKQFNRISSDRDVVDGDIIRQDRNEKCRGTHHVATDGYDFPIHYKIPEGWAADGR